MSTTQINGGTQVKPGTITTTQLSSSAGITDGQLATPYIKADGTRAFTGAVSMGSNNITNVTDPVNPQDAATKNYVDATAQGLDVKDSVEVATAAALPANTYANGTSGVGATLTANANGALVADGYTVLLNDRVLVQNEAAPANNGIYKQTTLGTASVKYVLTREPDFNTSTQLPGAFVFVINGTANANAGFVCTSTGTTTFGTTAINFTQFSGAGEITVDSTITKSGNQLSRPAITGDVTISTGSNAATIAAAAVTLAKQANLAANSVIGNSTGSSATPTAVPLASAATASAVALRDANANLTANAYIGGVTTTATAAGTTTLTVSSTQTQQFTGTTTQTVVLPNATTLVNGQQYLITNRSTGVVTVNMNGATLLQTMAAGSQLLATLISNGTAAGTWDAAYAVTNAAGGTVTSASVVTANGFAGTVATATTTPAITLTTSVTGVLKGNGTAISAATAGTDYLAPSNYIVRETPSGTVNGSTTAFTLANTPSSGSEMVFLNGVLQEGGSQDYSISTNTITFVSAPLTGDRIRVTYLH